MTTWQIGTSLVGILLAADSVAQPLKIDDLIVAQSVPAAQLNATVRAAKTFYQFWNTGSESLLRAAVAESFTDHTLPPGRPQGPAGPLFASQHFRAAVPDLSVEVRKMVVANDYVTVHMEFRGHFSGSFGRTRGEGQTVDFIATDLLKVTNGRITDNWHIEDNLTLFTQMAVAKISE